VNKLKAWLYAFRLRTLPLAFSSIITGSALAFVDHTAQFSWLVFGLCLLTTLLLQILSNLANDYGDSEKGTDNVYRIGPTRAVQAGMLSYTEIKTGIVVAAVLSFISGSVLVLKATEGLDLSKVVIFFALGIAAIIAAIKYTVGKNAYGYQGLGDLAVLFFFGFVGVGGSYYLLAHQLKPAVLLPAFTIGAFSAAVLNLNNMRDYEGDMKAGKMTLVGKIGIEQAKKYHSTIIILGFMAAIMYVYMHLESSIQFLFIITMLLFKKHLNIVEDIEDPVEFDPQLKQLALSTFIFAILFGIGLIIGSDI
jgi:1,4-dihydroxy-2-naphthoate polyprenyltransferase